MVLQMTMRLDNNASCFWGPSKHSLVHPSLEDEHGSSPPESVNKEKVKGILGVCSRQELLEVDGLLSKSCSDTGEDSSEDDEDCIRSPNCEGVDPLPDRQRSLLSTYVPNSSSVNALMKSPVATQLIQGLSDAKWGFRFRKYPGHLIKIMSELKDPNLRKKAPASQLPAETCTNSVFPLPLPFPEKHLLQGPQRKNALPAAHPLPQPPVPSSSSNQASGAQAHDRRGDLSWRLQSANEPATREALPLPPMTEHAKATSLEAPDKRCFVAPSTTRRPSSLLPSARESLRPGHLLPSPPGGVNSPSSSSRASKPLCPRKWSKGVTLGRGTFGVVYEGLNLEDGSFFAVKVSNTEDASPEIQQEVDVLSKLDHPNIVRYLGSSVENNRLCIFLELVRMGSLESILRKYARFGERTIRSYTRQILHGLEYLHAQKTIHRDIKCANILVDVNGQVKLSDFGIAKEVSTTLAHSSKGTPLYMAPEVLTPGQNCYSFSADIWSLGCTVLEMADGRAPWSNLPGFAFLFKVKSGELPPMPEHLSPEGKDFICRCLKLNAKDRPTASELLQHPFVSLASPAELPILRAPLSLPSIPGLNSQTCADQPSSSSITQYTL